MPSNPPFSEEIVELWNDSVWSQKEMREFTENFHAGDVTSNLDATNDYRQVIHCKEFNFVQFFIQRFPVPQVGGCQEYRYRVRVEYYLEDSIPNQNKIQNFFEVLHNVILAELGNTWSDFVQGSFPDDTWPDLRPFGEIDNTLIRVGSFTYFAEAHA